MQFDFSPHTSSLTFEVEVAAAIGAGYLWPGFEAAISASALAKGQFISIIPNQSRQSKESQSHQSQNQINHKNHSHINHKNHKNHSSDNGDAGKFEFAGRNSDEKWDWAPGSSSIPWTTIVQSWVVSTITSITNHPNQSQ